MNVKIKELSREEIMQGFGQLFETELQIDCKETSTNFGTSGKILSYQYPFGLSFIFIKGCFKEDIKITVTENSKSTLLLMYCTDGGISHTLNDGRLQYKLSATSGSISSSPKGQSQFIDIKRKEKIKLGMILVQKDSFHKKIRCEMEQMPPHLDHVFKKENENDTFLYNGFYSYAISNILEEIQENEYEGVVKSIFIEAKLLELFSYQIKQYKDDQKSPSEKVMMRESDLKQIMSAKRYIQLNFKNPPTIKELAKEIGMNETKLKKSFKLVFGTTIGTFVRGERLMQASILLVQDNYSIREVSSIVGYENQSHFSKQFKKKFGMLPKDYRQLHVEGNISTITSS